MIQLDVVGILLNGNKHGRGFGFHFIYEGETAITQKITQSTNIFKTAIFLKYVLFIMKIKIKNNFQFIGDSFFKKPPVIRNSSKRSIYANNSGIHT